MTPQENIFPAEDNAARQIEGKVLILYFLRNMDFPVSSSQIALFAQSLEFMNFYSLQEYVNALTEAGMLEKTWTENKFLYTITPEGDKVLDAFWDNIPKGHRHSAARYISSNYKEIKQEYEVSASYIFNHDTNEYIVKCCAFEDEITLMEINVSVAARELAAVICTNWKGNVAHIYEKVMRLLTADASKIEFKE